MEKSFQDRYPEQFKRCYGCGTLNEHGLQIRSFWDGETAVAVFQPKTYHLSFPGYVYGGLLASLIDCHCIGTAAAAAGRANEEDDAAELRRFVTASLQVDYLKPTPLGPPIEVRALILEIKERKVVLEATISTGTVGISARGRVIAVQMPEHLS